MIVDLSHHRSAFIAFSKDVMLDCVSEASAKTHIAEGSRLQGAGAEETHTVLDDVIKALENEEWLASYLQGLYR
jgi:hypothetical protein